MPSIEVLARQIADLGVPALFVDTCSLLDIPRLAIARRFRSGEVESARRLLSMATGSPAACLLIVPSPIRKEWDENIENVVKEGKSHLESLDQQAASFHEACQSLEITVPFDRARYAESNLIWSLFDLSRRLIDAAIIIDADLPSRLKAGDRVMDKIPPASIKQEFKDCIIIEECLSVCRKLKALESKSKRVFCTSNKTDYALHGKLLEPLEREFADVGLAYARNLSEAIHAFLIED